MTNQLETGLIQKSMDNLEEKLENDN